MRISQNRWAAVGALSLVGLVVSLDTTVLNVALPTLALELGASTSQLQWFADAYLLALAVLLLPGGLLGDRLGRKSMTQVALLVFGAASLWCAYSRSTESLIAARALMGAGAALVTPLTFSWLVVLFDEDERSRALGVLGGAGFLGLPLGPILSGWLLQHYQWGSIFLVNVPLVAVALLAASVLLPAGTSRVERPVDAVGMTLSMGGLAALTYGLIEAPVRGWADATSLLSSMAGLFLLAAFVWWEARQGSRALMNMRVWREPAFAWGAGVLSVGTMLGMVALFSVPLYLQAVLGADAMGTGIRLVPIVAGIILGIVLSLGVSRRYGYRVAVVLGLAMIVGSAILGTRTSVTTGYGGTVVWLTMFGVGFGGLLVACQNLALSQLSEDTAGAGAATLQVMRQTASVVGIATLVSVLNTVYRHRVDVVGLPGPIANVVRDSVQAGLTAAERLDSPALALSVKTAFLDGMASQLWIGAALAGVAALAAVKWMPPLLPRTKRPANESPAPRDRQCLEQ